MTVTPDVPVRARATSTVTLVALVCHDGHPQAVADHLAAEVRPLLDRWGVELLTHAAHAQPITFGDPPSGELPAVTCPHDHYEEPPFP